MTATCNPALASRSGKSSGTSVPGPRGGAFSGNPGSSRGSNRRRSTLNSRSPKSSSSGAGRSAGSMTIRRAHRFPRGAYAASAMRTERTCHQCVVSILGAALPSLRAERTESETGMPAVKVFMSYRRADNPFLAGRLKDELGRVFGDRERLLRHRLDPGRRRLPRSHPGDARDRGRGDRVGRFGLGLANDSRRPTTRCAPSCGKRSTRRSC